MGWRATDGVIGSGPFFNPFCDIPDAWRVDHFTERLPSEAGRACLQWAVATPSIIDSARENIVYAAQVERPDFLDRKQEYFAFANLRAYPLTQIRTLITALHDRSLPLVSGDVHTLLQMALFQLGEISDSRLLWKTELFLGRGFDALVLELQQLALEHAEKPRDAHAMRCIGFMAAYAAQWHQPACSICIGLAKASQKWSDELAAQFEGASLKVEVNLRERQCMYSMYAIMCASSVLRLKDTEVGLNTDASLAIAKLVCSAMVTIRNGLVLAEGVVKPKLASLMVEVEHAMAACAWDLKEAVDATLSICTHAVQKVLQHAPSDLEWARASRAASGQSSLSTHSGSTLDFCYVAKHVDGDGTEHMYCINIVNGIVLYDGEQPGRLPASITTHAKYKR